MAVLDAPIEWHMQTILRKLGVGNRTGALSRAFWPIDQSTAWSATATDAENARGLD